MRRTSLVLAVSALSAAGCSVAHGATETWLVPLSASFAGLSGTADFTYSVPLFDQQGGNRVLTAVQVTGEAMYGTSIQGFNGEVLPYTATVSYAGGLSGTLPGGAISAFASETATEPALFPATFGNFSFLPSGSVISAIGNIAAFAAPNGGISLQTGTFTGGLTLPPLPGLTWSTPSQLMGGSLTIVYTYEVVPAPASAVLMVMGGLAVQRRRR